MRRIEILAARDSYPSNLFLNERILKQRAQRAAWEAYLQYGNHIGLLDADLIERLKSTNPSNFRSAMSECLAAWFLGTQIKLNAVGARVKGKGRSVVDLSFLFGDEQVFVEVKSPYLPHPKPDQFYYSLNNGDEFKGSLVEANKQFQKEKINVLCIVPAVWYSVYYNESPLIKAFYGKNELHLPLLDPVKGRFGAAKTVFKPDGALLRYDKQKLGQRYTRISAILLIEEPVIRSCTPNVIAHNSMLFHNPYAVAPLSEAVFSGIPQFVVREPNMVWMDRPSVS